MYKYTIKIYIILHKKYKIHLIFVANSNENRLRGPGEWGGGFDVVGNAKNNVFQLKFFIIPD